MNRVNWTRLVALIDNGNDKEALSTGLLKMSHVFGLRNSTNHKNRQFSQYRSQSWGQPGLVTSVELQKVNIKWQKSDVFIF